MIQPSPSFWGITLLPMAEKSKRRARQYGIESPRSGVSVDVVLEKVKWTVKWLHYLNYKAVLCSSSTRH